MNDLSDLITKIQPQVGSGVTFVVIIVGWLLFNNSNRFVPQFLMELFKAKRESKDDQMVIVERRTSALDARAIAIVQRQDDKIAELDLKVDRLERENMHLYRQLIETRQVVIMDRNTMDMICSRANLAPPEWRNLPEVKELPKDEG